MLIPLLLLAVFFYNRIVEKRELRKSYQIEEMVVPMPTPRTEGYTERKVDLNDYFNSSNGWDDDTDWNSAGLEDEENQKAFDKVLEKNGNILE